MKRFYLLLFGLIPFFHQIGAQSMFWATPCSDTSFCLPPNICDEQNVQLSVIAGGACGTQTNYLYRIDLQNDGIVEILGYSNAFDGVLPKGIHQIFWRASDLCGNVTTCTYLINVKDCQLPNLLCINGLTQNLDAPLCTESFAINNFIQSISDNCTPASELERGLRIGGTGTGFATAQSVSFDECNEGFNFVEVWVRDGSGNLNTCNTYIFIQNVNSGGCVCNNYADITIKGCVTTPDTAKIPQYFINAHIQTSDSSAAPLSTFIHKSIQDSCYTASKGNLPFGRSYTVAIQPERFDDPLNGVTTHDLLLISKNILGLQPFTNLYQFMAADVNRSKSLTTFDIVEIRKLILGIYDTLPTVQAWQFVRPFSDPQNLSLWPNVQYQYFYAFDSLTIDTTLQNLNFIAIKSGDVNNTAQFGANVEDRNGSNPYLLSTPDRLLQAGETVTIDWATEEPVDCEGWQLGLNFDPELAQLEQVNSTYFEDFKEDNYSIQAENQLRSFWYNVNPKATPRKSTFISLKIKALQTVMLSSLFQQDGGAFRSELYESGKETPRKIILQVANNPEAMSGGTQFFVPSPNPFRSKTSFGLLLPSAQNISISIVDTQGKLVYESHDIYPKGYQNLEISTADWPSSIYFYKINTENGQFTGKIVKE